MHPKISIAAVGDISFMGRHTEKPSSGVFSEVIPIFKKFNLVIGNLESSLVACGEPVPGKCTLRGSPGWAEVLKEAGVNLLSLANNHMMDYGEQGLLSTISSLKQAGLLYIGAGRNREEACSPVFVNVGGDRIGFLARTSVIVSSPSYAENSTPGVAFLDRKETEAKIRVCKDQCDLLVLLIHWGLEEYSYPTPEQRLLAKKLISAGADLILGHHPHVLQGIEQIGTSFVAYSLGNFLFDGFEWLLSDPESLPIKKFSSLSAPNRKGMILDMTWNSKEGFRFKRLFTHIEENGRVVFDWSHARDIESSIFNMKLRYPFYQYWWRIYALHQECRLRFWPRIRRGMNLKKLLRLRPKHFIELFQALFRSGKIAAEKTTNPYE